MNILMDTHIAIWALADDSRLNKYARELLLDPGNNLYYSALSVLEVDMKSKSRKNNLGFSSKDFVDYCRSAGYIQSPLKEEHITKANDLIWDGNEEEHRDPFDRILLAQAIAENMRFMTADKKIPYFKTNCIIAL